MAPMGCSVNSPEAEYSPGYSTSPAILHIKNMINKVRVGKEVHAKARRKARYYLNARLLTFFFFKNKLKR